MIRSNLKSISKRKEEGNREKIWKGSLKLRVEDVSAHTINSTIRLATAFNAKSDIINTAILPSKTVYVNLAYTKSNLAAKEEELNANFVQTEAYYQYPTDL